MPSPTRGHAVLVSDDDNGRLWTLTTTIRCTAAVHDTMTAYKNHRCRCPEAIRKTVDYQRRRDAGLIHPQQPAAMTMRRLQALAVIGWTAEHIAPHVHRNPVSLSQIRRGAQQMVTGATAVAVHHVYRRLHNTMGPSDRSRSYAARQRWEGPSPILLSADIDEVAVARACTGTPIKLSRGERLAAVHQLRVRRSLDYGAIAGLLHVAERQVHRDLTDLGLIARAASR